MKIISDGTAAGTQVLDDKGEPLALPLSIVKITIDADTGMVTAQLTVALVSVETEADAVEWRIGGFDAPAREIIMADGMHIDFTGRQPVLRAKT